MEKNYPVYYNEQQIGTVCVTEEGLYYLFRGTIRIIEGKIWRVKATCENAEIELGICLFKSPVYIIDKRIPKKKVTEENWRFIAYDPAETGRTVIPLLENQPFDQLEFIESAQYSVKNDDSYLILNTDH